MNRVGVEAWLKECEVVNYTLNEDLSVDVEGDVDISFKDLSVIPVSFVVRLSYKSRRFF